ncbi:tetratricopeptide repeat protein [Dyella telluris]|uniref:protein O-GlcNAc transferase n=1 Tax=Dyella telluris TaxID=2763498 RepID=A0A7G8Q8V9_9GAMM|nr:tetratricopeptide repeat protein [Dyella telluris]QNK03217.1 tetratricopeptide repeat protein [Dyella telluris]
MTPAEPRTDAPSIPTGDERAGAQDPHSSDAHFHRGLVLSQQARHEEALAAFQQAAALAPDWADAQNSVGAELAVLGRSRDAELAFRTALTIQPTLAASWCNLGQLLAEAGRCNEAVDALRQAIAHGAVSAHVYHLLGSVLITLGEHAEAEQQLRRTLELDAHHALAALKLADLLRMSNRVDEAESYASAVVERHPHWAIAHFALGNVAMSKGIGNPGLAVGHVQHAVQLDPDNLSCRVNLAYLQIFASEDGHAVLNECRALTAHFEEPFLRTTIAYPNDPTPSRRLRIGYVSPDFREHCQSLFMTPLLKHHDHAEVEVFGYASVKNPDAVTQQLAALVDVWRDVSSLDDDRLALQILDDQIDILVDLTMHMSNGRPLLFARRPAPVQVAWLAYPGTTGSKAIGYRLTDPWLDPPDDAGADGRYSERSIRLPDTFWCYDPLTTESEPGPLPATQNGYVTFGCLNNPHKLTDRTFALWAQVLHNVPRSRLLLLLPDGSARDIVQKKFEQLGIDGSRLTLVRFQKREDYLRTYQSIDIALDVFPYNGHTTSLDALWMGVPVATIIGTMPASRAGYSLLSNIGLSELAAATDAGFVTCATRLASNLPALAELRAGLRARMEASPLMDGVRFARGMEAAYRQMWTEWCGTQHH